jgi:hypothetical protein
LDGSVPEVLFFSGGASFSGAELVLIFLSSLAGHHLFLTLICLIKLNYH